MDKRNNNKKFAKSLRLWMPLGIAIGAALGVANDNIGPRLALGPAFGVGLAGAVTLLFSNIPHNRRDE